MRSRERLHSALEHRPESAGKSPSDLVLTVAVDRIIAHKLKERHAAVVVYVLIGDRSQRVPLRESVEVGRVCGDLPALAPIRLHHPHELIPRRPAERDRAPPRAQ